MKSTLKRWQTTVSFFLLRGVLSIAWSLADPELLLSCGKDNRILCWNPNTGEVKVSLTFRSEESRKLSNPLINNPLHSPGFVRAAHQQSVVLRRPVVSQEPGGAFSRRIRRTHRYLLHHGRKQPGAESETSRPGENERPHMLEIKVFRLTSGYLCDYWCFVDQISTSFGNMDPFGTGQTLPPLQLPQTAAPPATIMPLKKPPKWIRRPVGASFAVSPSSLLMTSLIRGLQPLL